MNVAHLALLRELAAQGSLAAVAEATHRTPSAVSQQLRTAERELDATLVEPAGRGLRLTAAGRLLAEAAEDVLASLARAEARLDALRGEPSGLVTIGTLPSAGEVLVPSVMVALRDRPITLVVEDFDIAEEHFARRAADTDIVIGHSITGPVPAGAERLACVPLCREPLDVALPAAHPLAASTRVRVQDLADVPWVGVPEGYPFDTVRLAIENALGRPLQVVQRVRDNRMVEALVAAGIGVALLPRFTTSPRPDVVLRPLGDVVSARHLVAMCRPDRAERAAVRMVLEALRRAGSRLG